MNQNLNTVSESGYPCQNEFKVAQAIIRPGEGRGLGGRLHRVKKKKIPEELSFGRGKQGSFGGLPV